MSQGPRISLIVAMASNRVIGHDGRLPWHLPADLRFFKTTTMGHPIVMGRRTYESIGRPLPGRRSLVLSRDRTYSGEGIEVYGSLDNALAACNDGSEVFVIGGASVYAAALPRAVRLWLTRVHAVLEGDTWLPEFEKTGWRLDWSESRAADQDHAHPFTFERWERNL